MRARARRWLAPGAIAAAWATVGAMVLARGEPHEDAFILFRYAHNVGRGFGVVWWPGGPHAEGATDFAWTMLLAGASAIGLDVAVAALVANAVGVAVCARVLLDVAAGHGGARRALAATVPLVLLAPSSAAGWLGFSAPVVAAIALVMVRDYVAATRSSLARVPAWGLALALVRPDGAILAAGAWAVAVAQARRAGVLRPLLATTGACTAFGAAYFAWRWRYFGEALPLPIVVKSHCASPPPGVGETIDWIVSSVAPFAGLAALGRLLLGRAGSASARIVTGLAPFVVHAATFALGAPSQNVANRFESPDAMAVIWAALALAASRERAQSLPRALVYAGATAAAFVPHAVISRDALSGAFDHGYVAPFARELARVAPDARLAVTEAGRLPYWTDAPTLDLVGLNTRETAYAPPRGDLLDRFDPDVVFLHPAGALDEGLVDAGGLDVVRLDPPIERLVPEWRREWLSTSLPAYDALHAENVVVAPPATIAWLDRNAARFDAYAVRFESRWFHWHLCAVRRALPAHDAIVRALAASHAARTSYSSLQRGTPE